MSENVRCEHCGKEMRNEPGYTGLFHVNETDAMNCFRKQRDARIITAMESGAFDNHEFDLKKK